MQRHLLTALALITAPGAAWLIGSWLAQLEVRRLWLEGRRHDAMDLTVAASLAPLFLGFVLFNLPRLWPYALASSALHVWFLCRHREMAAFGFACWARRDRRQPLPAAVPPTTATIQPMPAARPDQTGHLEPAAPAPAGECAV